MPGYHLPFFGAVADGLFAKHDFDIELLESPPGAERVKMLASGGGDFLLTPVLYYLQAFQDGPLDVRFVEAVHQRSSLACLVREDSVIATSADLQSCVLGGPQGAEGLGWLLRECTYELARAGLNQPTIVPLSYRDAAFALRDGTIDALPNLAELAPLVSRGIDTPLRVVPVGSPVCLSGLAAGNWVPQDVVDRMREVLRETVQRQREEPERGVGLLRARYPTVNAEDAVASWSLLEEYVISGDGLGTLDHDHWGRSVDHVASAHNVAAPSARGPTNQLGACCRERR